MNYKLARAHDIYKKHAATNLVCEVNMVSGAPRKVYQCSCGLYLVYSGSGIIPACASVTRMVKAMPKPWVRASVIRHLRYIIRHPDSVRSHDKYDLIDTLKSFQMALDGLRTKKNPAKRPTVPFVA